MDQKFRRVMHLLPIMTLYIVLIGGGLLLLVKDSLGYIPKLGFHQVTLSHYKSIVMDRHLLGQLAYSLRIAGISAILSMTIGTWVAYTMTGKKSDKPSSIVIMRIGMILPYLYMVFIVLLVFSQSGLVSRVFNGLNITSSTNDFPNLVYGSTGIILTYTLKGVPFVIFLVYNVMNQIKSYDDVASTLGSSKWQVFRRIYLPLSRDTIVWSGMVLFIFDLGAFEVPFLLSKIKQQGYAVKIYSSYLAPSIQQIPYTMAMTMVLFLVGIGSVFIFALATRWFIRQVAK